MFLLNTAADAEFTTLAVDRFIGFLDAQIKKRLQVEEQRTLAECLQDVGVALSPGGHSKLTAAMLLRTKSREYGPEEKLAVLRISHLLALQAEVRSELYDQLWAVTKCTLLSGGVNGSRRAQRTCRMDACPPRSPYR